MNNILIVDMIINQLSCPWWNLGHDEQHKDTNVLKWLCHDQWDQYHEDKISENYH